MANGRKKPFTSKQLNKEVKYNGGNTYTGDWPPNSDTTRDGITICRGDSDRWALLSILGTCSSILTAIAG